LSRMRDAGTNRKRMSPDAALVARVAAIGPASENLVRYANVLFDLSHAAGRCGIGAVMARRIQKGSRCVVPVNLV